MITPPIILIPQQGHCDFPLTDLGTDQAHIRGSTLKDVNWTLVYSSDLTRAFHTSQIILSKSESEVKYSQDHIIQTPLLREINFGVREGY